jgi:hypothetical protein
MANTLTALRARLENTPPAPGPSGRPACRSRPDRSSTTPACRSPPATTSGCEWQTPSGSPGHQRR